VGWIERDCFKGWAKSFVTTFKPEGNAMNTYTTVRDLITSLWNGNQDSSGDARELSAMLAPMVRRSDLANAETILIIDEEPSNLVLLNSLLGRQYRVKLADTAVKGLELAMSAEQPDLVILEASMKRLDGFKVCELLQQNSKTRHIPIMFLSSNQSKDAVDRGISLGAVDFIFKPVPGFKLLEKISSYFAEYAWVQRERRFARGY
jgi:PleD family two-component response regulator